MKSRVILKNFKILMVNLYKSKAKDHNEKDAEIQGYC